MENVSLQNAAEKRAGLRANRPSQSISFAVTEELRLYLCKENKRLTRLHESLPQQTISRASCISPSMHLARLRVAIPVTNMSNPLKFDLHSQDDLDKFWSMLSRARARKNQMTAASVKNNRERFRPENTEHKDQG